MNSLLRGLSIRACGLVMLGLGWASGHALWLLHGRAPGVGVFLFALATFLTASLGSAMLVVGPHLFDKVEVSERWARMAVDRDHANGSAIDRG
ncbi:MAG: hypothetical protein ABI240_06935 [Sphingomonas sp.]